MISHRTLLSTFAGRIPMDIGTNAQPKPAKELPSPCPRKEKCEALTNTIEINSEVSEY